MDRRFRDVRRSRIRKFDNLSNFTYATKNYMVMKNMENVKDFVTGPHPETRRKWLEIQTLISPEYSLRSSEYSVWPEFLAGHGWSRDRSGFVALGLAIPAPPVTRPSAAWFTGNRLKQYRNPRNWDSFAAASPPQSGRPDLHQTEEH